MWLQFEEKLLLLSTTNVLSITRMRAFMFWHCCTELLKVTEGQGKQNSSSSCVYCGVLEES